MTELRRRMDEDMIVRGLADRTRETYLWAVKAALGWPSVGHVVTQTEGGRAV